MHPNDTRTPHFPANLEDYAPWVAKYGLRYPYGECQCGCGEKTRISTYNCAQHGYAKNHPIPYIIHHHKLRSLEDAFWAHIDKRDPSECWEWTATRDSRGYGAFTWNARHYRAHRFSYELHNGPIPEGLFVLHRCDNPPCCNPNHLVAGTQSDNMQDMARKKRYKDCRKLNDEQEKEVRSLYATGTYNLEELGQKFGVSAGTIKRILRRHPDLLPVRLARPSLEHNEIKEICRLYASGTYTQFDLARMFNADQSSISRAISGKISKKYESLRE